MDIQCSTCIEKISLFAIGQCNHKKICHECFLRGILFYKIHKCQICRVFKIITFHQAEMANVIITDNFKDSYEDMLPKCVSHKFKDTIVYFTSNEILLKVQSDLSFMCKICSIDSETKQHFKSLSNLKYHLKSEHSLYLCDCCSRGRNVFSYNFRYYKRKVLCVFINRN